MPNSAIFKSFDSNNVKTTKSFLNQLIDVLQQDISSSVSRRKYQVFVTGGIGPGVTSSLFQTVYDQDFTLQTANPIFDITVGISRPPYGKITNEIAMQSGYRWNYPSSSLMMREKTDIYGQFAQLLLGSNLKYFNVPAPRAGLPDANKDIDAALFLSFKRLFSRDQIKRETFAMRFYQSASFVSKYTFSSTGDGLDTDGVTPVNSIPPGYTSGWPSGDSLGVSNLYVPSTSGSAIFTDIGSSNQRYFSPGGQYGYIVNAANTSLPVGILYYDAGVAVFDIEQITSGSQFISGTISAMNAAGYTTLGGRGTETYKTARLVPDLMVSASIDDIVDHFCYTRFGDSAQTAITFQNVTNINSTLIYCRVGPDEFNLSANPTYVDPNGQLMIRDPALNDENQEIFSYITTIGLYDATNDSTPIAVAKLSRPVEKNPGRDLTFRIRLDF